MLLLSQWPDAEPVFSVVVFNERLLGTCVGDGTSSTRSLATKYKS